MVNDFSDNNVKTGESINAQVENNVMQSLDASAKEMTADEVEYQQAVEQCRITLDKEYRQKEFLFRVSGIPTLSIGDIHLIQAQAKQGKSKLVTILVAACISGEFGPVEYALDRGIRVVIFDTEQFEFDTFKQLKDMHEIGGETGEYPIDLQVYNLRRYGYEERMKFVSEVITRERPQLVVVDGIRDLTPDINDPVRCPMLVQEMMRLTCEAECAIIGVLHNNPGEGKARGWVGTEWINKCAYSFEVEKNGSIVTVKTPVYRGAPVPDWQFTFGEGGRPTCDLKFIQHRREIDDERKKAEYEKQRALKDSEFIQPIIDILNKNGGSMYKTNLAQAIEEAKIMGHTSAGTLIKRLMERENPPFIMRDKMIGVRTEPTEDKIF